MRRTVSGGTRKSNIATVKIVRGLGPQGEGETYPSEKPVNVIEASGDDGVNVPAELPQGDESGALDEQEEEQVEPEEAEPLKTAPDPKLPDKAAIELHRKTHIPFRIWCRFCIMGRGLGEQRGRHWGRHHAIPRIGVDYWFITTGGIWRRDELKELRYTLDAEGDEKLATDRKEGKIIKCLIIRCFETKCLFAHVVPCKGLDEDKFVLNLVVDAVVWLGHAKLILKSDGENSITKLVKKSLEEIKCQVEGIESVTSEESHPYDSQSNGGTEVGIKIVRGVYRTLKLNLEERIGREVPPSHPLLTWLVEHTAVVLNACVRGNDGKTAWERARGRPFGMRIHEYGESVFWKQPLKGPQHDVKGNMGPRQYVGNFLGYNKTSNSYRILTEDGEITKARALTARPIQDRWDAEKFANVVVTPWSTRKREDAVRSSLGAEVPREEPPRDALPPNPRRLKITKQMLLDPGVGTSEGCPQCRHFRTFGETKNGIGHTEKCRERVLEALAGTADGTAKLARHDERIDRAIAERIQDADDRQRVERDSAPRPDAGQDAERDHQNRLPGSGGSSGSRSLKERGDDPERQGGDTHQGNEPEAMDGADAEMNGGEATRETTQGDDMMIGHVGLDETHVMLLGHLGVQRGAYRRESRKAYNRIVSEIYSPPRVTRMISCLPSLKLLPGYALDITVEDPDDGLPWDFDNPAKREKARKLIREQKPLFLIGSPMCTAWCTWQRLNEIRGDGEKLRRAKVRARLRLDFTMELYAEQVEAGRYFLHEHPKSASSWEEESVRRIRQLEGVDLVHADQCQYGNEVTFGRYRGQPVKKPTGFMSNAPALLEKLTAKCSGRGGECSRRRGGTHAVCGGRVAKEAAKYSKDLCRAIVKGMHAQMRRVGIVNDHEVGLHAMTDEPAVEELVRKDDPRYTGKCKDDITGQVLRDDLVREARAKELEYFKSKGVWAKRPRREAKQVTGRPPISVRWVDVNKGDDLSPRYRSRLVARQLKAHDRTNASYFAPTPPLEALRTVLSLAATKIGDWRPDCTLNSERRMQLSFLDITRAYFNAPTDETSPTYVNLPPEEKDFEDKCGLLLRHMYGTRAAADGWQEEYRCFLVSKLGFTQGTASPCLFRHHARRIVLSVHGDDFTAAGSKRDLDWYEAAMKEHYELTLQPRLGPGDDAKEAVVLNRIIRWTNEGIEMEADPRQAEKLIGECGMEGVNSVATPGVRVSFAEAENDKPLPEHLHTAFRGAAARANYLAADRPDCQFAAKEVCRWMAKPTSSSWQALKRLCRYLVGLPRLVHIYRWQEVDTVDVYTDTDWNGCPRTRKSTSGGCVLLGGHTIKTWSSTQSSVSLSSGEAEFNGVVRGAGVGLGYRSLLRDLGHEVPLRLWTDSSAALGICSRQGLGKLRHLDTHTLWVQQAVRARQVDLRKIAGDVNPAGMFTKHSLTREKLMSLAKLFDAEYRGGRAASAPQTRERAREGDGPSPRPTPLRTQSV